MGEHYRVSTGPLGGRYVHAKLKGQRVEREYLVQATSDDRIIVQGSKPGQPGRATPYADCIGCFNVDGTGGRFTTRGGFFPHLAIAEPFDFPPDFIRACLEVCQPLDAVTDGGGIIVNHTVQAA